MAAKKNKAEVWLERQLKKLAWAIPPIALLSWWTWPAALYVAKALWVSIQGLIIAAIWVSNWWWAVALGLATVLLVFPQTRAPTIQLPQRLWVRYKWHRCTSDAGMREKVDLQTFHIRRMLKTRGGWKLLLVSPRRTSLPGLKGAEPLIEVGMQAWSCKISKASVSDGFRCLGRLWGNREHGQLLTIDLVMDDPLKGEKEVKWPLANALRLSLWDPIPIGEDHQGQPVKLILAWIHLLLGGMPGMGKSALFALCVAVAALDPTVRIFLLDGGRSDGAIWRHCCERFIGGKDLRGAKKALEEVVRIMDERAEWLDSIGKRKLPNPTWFAENGIPQIGLVLVAVDEIWAYVAGKNPLCTEIQELLEDIAARGRKYGVILIATCQKPTADRLPTSIRDVIAYRGAFYCSNWQMSDAVLGAHAAKNGADAHELISHDQKGVLLLLSESDRPQRLRAYYLDDDDIAAIATRAAKLRADYGAPPSDPSGPDDGETVPAPVLPIPGATPVVAIAGEVAA